jgi:hypothetical protein
MISTAKIIADARRRADTAKNLYWERLRDIDEHQAESLVSFAQSAFEQETERGDRLDQKAQWLLTAALALLAVLAALLRWAETVRDPAPYLFPCAVAVALLLLSASSLALWSIRVRNSWSGPDPESVLQPEVLLGEETSRKINLRRQLVLHYLDLYEFNQAVTSGRGGALRASLWLVLAAVTIQTIVGLALVYSRPTAPVRPPAVAAAAAVVAPTDARAAATPEPARSAPEIPQ